MSKAPQKINNFILFDWETGGIDKKEGLHSKKYPVTEFAAIAIDGVSLEEIVRYDALVKPYDSNLIYSAEAAKISGITKEMCERDGIPLRQLVKDLCQLFKEANVYNSKIARPQLIAHNGAYDKQFLQDVFIRAEVDLSEYVDGDKDAHGNFIPVVLDTIDYAKQIWAEETVKETKFNLHSCCERVGIPLIDAHRAMSDVIPMTDLWRYFIKRMRSGEAAQVIEAKENTGEYRKTLEW